MSAPPASDATPLHAGFWRRGAAAFVDSVLLAIPNYALGVLFSQNALGVVLPFVLAVAYYAGFHSSAVQATPGKMAFGIKVTGLDGERIGIVRAVGRVFAWFLSYLLLFIGLLMAAFTRRKQALHDMLCGTLVVSRAASAEEVRAGGGPMRLTTGVVLVGILLALVPLAGIVAAISIPAYQDYVQRAAVAEVLAATQPLRNEVENALANNRPIAARKASIATGHATGATLSPQGTITVQLAPALTGSAASLIVLAPPEGDRQWRCTAVGVRPVALPASCRP